MAHTEVLTPPHLHTLCPWNVLIPSRPPPIEEAWYISFCIS